jgi:flagella basal body P-ring formation protein FlgA
MFSLQQFARSAHQQFQALRAVAIEELHTTRRAQLIAVVAVSLSLGVFTSSLVVSAQRNKSQWTKYQTVLVTRSAIRAGESLTANNTTLTRVPNVFVPHQPLTALPRSGTARVALSPNTIVSAGLSLSDDTSIAIPEGWRGVAMPRDLPAPPLSAGDVVDVVSTALTIAAGAIVVGVSAKSGVTIAVPAEAAPAVATAFRLGEASLVLAK